MVYKFKVYGVGFRVYNVGAEGSRFRVYVLRVTV
jgi:hypothetical protein